jgi:hypothetical protein
MNKRYSIYLTDDNKYFIRINSSGVITPSNYSLENAFMGIITGRIFLINNDSILKNSLHVGYTYSLVDAKIKYPELFI